MNDTVNLSKLPDKSQLLVRVGVQLGWIASQMNGGGITLTTGDRTQRLLVPASNINQKRIDSEFRKIMRYADPIARALFEGHIEDELMRQGKFKPIMSQDPSAPLSISGSVIPARWTAAPEHYQPKIVEEPKPVPRPPRTNPGPRGQEVATPLPAVRIVSEQPWLAKQSTSKGRGNAYPSQTTTERLWSDGTVDYICTACGEYTNIKAVSVARHYARTKDAKHPNVSKPTDMLVTAPYEAQHRPLAERAERLLRELRAAMQAIRGQGYDLSSEDKMLEVLAEQMVLSREASRVERDDPGPLTPEQIIERVRRLVDGGAYLEQIERTREMELEMAEITERAELAEARLATITRDVGALRELLSNVGVET